MHRQYVLKCDAEKKSTKKKFALDSKLKKKHEKEGKTEQTYVSRSAFQICKTLSLTT